MTARTASAALRAAFAAVCVSTSGCSSADFSMQKFGNSVLNTVGVKPATSAFDAATNIVKATESLSREEEYYLGRAVAARILARHPLYEDAEVQAYVRKVGAAVVAFAEKPATFGGYHFAVLDTTEVNAMSTPGGFIFVTRGLVDIMPDEDALASVLAHEVSHVEQGHGIKAISQAHMTEALASLGELATSFNCAGVITQATAVFGTAVDDVFEALVTKGYGRDQEYEADAGAVKILQRSGYNAYSIIDMLSEVERKEARAEDAGWFSTHPDPEDRISAVKGAIADAGAIERQPARERIDRFNKVMRRS